MNETPSYLSILIKGPKNNIQSLHTEVTIHYDSLIQKGKINPHRGYLSSISPKIHFGLNGIQNIDSMIIKWDSKEYSIIKNVDINQELNLDYASLKKLPTSSLFEKQTL